MKWLANLDLGKNELQNARVQNLASAPAGPVEGQVYYNTADKTYYGFNGTAWIDLGQVLDGTAIVTLINACSTKIDDDNLSATVADAIGKRHSHSNATILNAIEQAFTTALKNKLDGIATGATKVENSTSNGNIKINGVEKTVYAHPGSGTNPHNTTKSDLGLGNVDNKSSATIRDELTTANINKALGFTPKKVIEGLESARPAATGSLMVYIATDTKKIYFDQGASNWIQIGGQDTIAWGNVSGKPSTYTPPVASSGTLGGIKVGANLTIGTDGTLNANDNPTSYLIKQEKFIATEGQTVFNLTKGQYRQGLGALSIFIYGAKISNDAFTETSTTSFTLKTGLSAGDVVLVEYIQLINVQPYPIHASEHLSGGADPIPLATTLAAGLMAATDKSKLDGVAANANNYSHPASHPASMITGLATVATSGSYKDLSSKPSLGTAASKNTGTASGNVPIIGVDGKLDASIMPALAITETYVVNTQAGMLALTAETGDICVRTDLNKSFILKTMPASTLANWQELLTPTDVVTSVAGKTGAVTLAKNDVGLGNVDNVQQASKSEFNAHNTDSTRHITIAERSTWNAKASTTVATTSANGLMSSTDKSKLDGIALNANNYVHPNNSSTRHVTDTEKSTWNAKAGKYAAYIGNGTATEFTITHNLNSLDTTVSIRQPSTGEWVMTDIVTIDANNIKVLFAQAPSSNQYRVTVTG